MNRRVNAILADIDTAKANLADYDLEQGGLYG